MGGGGGHQSPPGTENLGQWRVQIKDSSVGGYGYFLEPHNARPTKCLT